MKVFLDFLIFPYWDFRSPFEVEGESYEFLNWTDLLWSKLGYYYNFYAAHTWRKILKILL